MLGRALVEEWDSDEFDELIAATSKDVDICDLGRVRKLISKSRPDWTVLTAAYTDVDGCEKNPELAHEINCVGASNVAREARDYGSRLVFISTDYVFDGSKSAPYETEDPVAPLSVYGRSKAAGERQVREIVPDACIVRTSWLFGPHGKCFPGTILRLSQDGGELKVVSDQQGSPTFSRDLASVIIRLVRGGASGTFHATNAGSCSWFEFAAELLKCAGFPDVQVAAISSEELNRPAPRPRYSVLSCASLSRFGLSLRTWQEAVRAYVREYVFPARAAAGREAAAAQQ